MTTSDIIRIMLIMRGMKETDICKALKWSMQALSNKMSRSSWKVQDLNDIVQVCGGELIIQFPDGTNLKVENNANAPLREKETTKHSAKSSAIIKITSEKDIVSAVRSYDNSHAPSPKKVDNNQAALPKLSENSYQNKTQVTSHLETQNASSEQQPIKRKRGRPRINSLLIQGQTNFLDDIPDSAINGIDKSS